MEASHGAAYRNPAVFEVFSRVFSKVFSRAKRPKLYQNVKSSANTWLSNVVSEVGLARSGFRIWRATP